MKEYVFSFDMSKIEDLEMSLWNRGFLCFDKESGVNVCPNPNNKQNRRSEYIQFKSRVRIDCALHKMRDILCYVNSMKLGKNQKMNEAFDFYDFLINECIVMDCIQILAGIFGVKEDLKLLKSQQDIFDGNGSDWDYVEYIRSLCVIHPLGTAFHPDFNGYRNYHCSRNTYWDSSLQDGYDLTAVIYDPMYSDSDFKFIRLKVSQFEMFLKKCIDFIDKIIEGVKQYEVVGIEKYREKIIKQPTEFVEYSEYIREIEKEYSLRGYYNQENNFEDFIRIFNTEVTNKDNMQKVELYRSAIKLGISYLHQRLQNMDEGKGKTTGICYDAEHNYTELFIELHNPDNLGSKGYGIRDGIKEHLDNSYPFPIIPMNRIEIFNDWIAKYVWFTGNETYDEKYVLIMTALYLDSMERNCTLNWNIPNNKMYREKIMSDEQYSDLINKAGNYY